jgi:hypothetical protein
MFKKINPILFIIGIAIAIFLVVFLIKSCDKNVQETIELPNHGNVNIETDPAKTIQYDSSKHLYKIQALEMELKDLKRVSAKNDRLLQEALDNVDKKTNRILILEGQIKKTFEFVELHDTIIKYLPGRDSVLVVRELSFSDKWMSIELFRVPGNDSVYGDLSAKAKAIVKYSWDRKWLLGKKHHYVSFKTDVPYFSITDAENVEITPKEGKFKVGLGIGYGLTYVIKEQRLVHGPTISASLLYTF